MAIAKKGSNEHAKEREIMTAKFRASYPKIFKPEAFGAAAPKYSIVMLFPKKGSDMKPLENAIDKAGVDFFGADKKKWPKDFLSPIKDGDEKSDQPGYAGHWVVNASSSKDYRPAVMDRDGTSPITEDDQTFYAGCWARALVFATGYDYLGKKGVTLRLQAVQKLADGERFSGRKAAHDIFEAYGEDDESENEKNYGID